MYLYNTNLRCKSVKIKLSASPLTCSLNYSCHALPDHIYYMLSLVYCNSSLQRLHQLLHYQMHIDPGKSWDLEFELSRPGKSWKISQMVAAFLIHLHQNPSVGHTPRKPTGRA